MTLLELLVAIALLAIITTLSWRALDSLGRSADRLEEDSRRWQSLALFFNRFANDVSQPAARAIRDEKNSLTQQPAWRGQPQAALAADDPSDTTALEFSRRSPTGRDLLRLGYRLRGNTLELLIWPSLDRAADSVPQIHPLQEDVSTLELRYLDSAGLWQTHWPQDAANPGSENLPRAVEITLTLRDGTRLQRIFAVAP